jgi:malonyl-CoA/methylmalonyl-CoA synthetase
LDVEREILALPYIQEVIVIGVQDDEFGQRVGAVITMQHDEGQVPTSTRNSTLDQLRSDLRSRLAGYKLPTLLVVVEGELPKTASGKVLKKVLGPKYFPADYSSNSNVQIWRARNMEERAKL